MLHQLRAPFSNLRDRCLTALDAVEPVRDALATWGGVHPLYQAAFSRSLRGRFPVPTIDGSVPFFSVEGQTTRSPMHILDAVFHREPNTTCRLLGRRGMISTGPDSSISRAHCADIVVMCSHCPVCPPPGVFPVVTPCREVIVGRPRGLRTSLRLEWRTDPSHMFPGEIRFHLISSCRCRERSDADTGQ